MINTLCFTNKLILPQTFRLLNVTNHAKSFLRNYSVRRCMLVVPAVSKRKIDTALQMRVDCINFTLFTDTQLDLKDHGRATLKTLLDEKKIADDETEWCVTIHPVQHQEDIIQDINTIFDAKCLPSAISIPHVSNCQQIEWFFQKMWEKIMERNVERRREMKILLEITSPKGMVRLKEICEKVKDLARIKSSPSLSFEFSALIYGYDTLKRHLGSNKTLGGLECLYSRQKLVLIAKAFGLQAIDFPHSNPKGGKELANECEDAVILGFTGKTAIYPSHIGIVQPIFNPTRSRVQDARIIAQCHAIRDQDISENLSVPPELSMDPDELQVAKNVLDVDEVAGKYRTDSGRPTI